MSNKKRFTDEGISRIWKSTLAQTVDSVGSNSKTKKDISQRVHNKSLSDKERDHDDLDAANIQAALRNIRSLPGSGHVSDGSFQISHGDSGKSDGGTNSNESTIKNIVVKINNDNALAGNDGQYHHDKPNGRHIREVRDNYKDTHDQSGKGGFTHRYVGRGSSHSLIGSGRKSAGSDKDHTRRSDLTSQKCPEDRRSRDLPPRLRSKNIGTEQSKSGESLDTEKVVVLDMNKDHAAPSKSMFDDKREMDAYDKWKLKRQSSSSSSINSNNYRPKTRNVSAPLKSNEPVGPPRNYNELGSKGEGKIESVTIYSSKVVHSENNQIRNGPIREKVSVVNHKLDTVSGDDSKDDKGDDIRSDSCDTKCSNKDTMDHAAVGQERHINSNDQNSALDKIQSLFQTYISPVTQRNNNNSDPNAESEARSHQQESASTPETEVVQKGELPDAHSMVQNMRTLQIADDKDIKEHIVTSENLGEKHYELRKEEQFPENPSANNRKLRYPSNVQQFNSPASIPSGFSSDYEVGIVSQSEAEEDDESPHPCMANLFPTSSPNHDILKNEEVEKYKEDEEEEETKRQQDFALPQSMSQWSSFYGNHQSMPHHQVTYPHPPWYHPYYNHPDPYRHPYHHHHPMAPYPGFMGNGESSVFPGQRLPPPSHSQYDQSAKNTNKLIIPAEMFNDEDSIRKMKDFVSTKAEDMKRYMVQRHGQEVPVHVVIHVSSTGVTADSDEASSSSRMAPYSYPVHGAWPYHMYSHPSMSYNYNSYWPQPYGDEGTADNMHAHVVHEPQHSQDEEGDGENLRIKHNHHPSDHGQPSSSVNRIGDQPCHTQALSQAHSHTETDAGSLSYTTADQTYSNSDSEDMKRQALFSEGNEGRGDDGQTTKRRMKDPSCGDENIPKDREGQGSNSKSVEDKDMKFRMSNSVSNFLNPNDLKNDWQSPPKPLSSTSSAAAKSCKYDLAAHNPSSRERDCSPHSGSRFQHRSYRNKQHSSSFDDDEEEDTTHHPRSTPPLSSNDNRNYQTRTSYDQKSVCVVERESSSRESTVEPKRLSEEYEPLSGKWAEICPEPEPTVLNNSYSARPSSQDFSSNPQHRRRSDSVIGYGSNKRSSLIRDYRLVRTPGVIRERWEDYSDWKELMMERSKTYNHQFIDTHCHLDFLYYRSNTATIPFKQYTDMHSNSFPVNYAGCIAVFCNPKVFSDHTQAHGILQLLVKEDNVWVAIGVHPKSATEFRTHHLLRMKRFLTSHPKVVALGEIGLDYSKSFINHADVQKEVFIQQLKLALELNLPLVIHCRDADSDCLEIMKKYIPVDYKIHLHCFTRNIRICQQWMDYFPNLFVGFTPLITYASARDATEAAALVPLDRLLLETDAPYFVPVGVNSNEMKFSHPGLALFTAERIAQIKNVSVDSVLEACRKNTRSMYSV